MPLLIKIRKFCICRPPLLRSISTLLIPLILMSFCNPPDTPFSKGLYDFGKANHRFTMPAVLEEISGISWMGNGDIACIEDETGTIYTYNLEKEEVTTQIEFGKKGDYEDITVIKKTAYVLKSNGHIYRVKNFRKDDFKVKRFKTPLSGKNDAEGMTYDADNHRLLIACKGRPSLEKENPFKGNRAVYAFDLDSNRLDEDPVYLLDLRDIEGYRDEGSFTQFSSKLAQVLGISDPYGNFRPSAIAIHPLTDEIYITSSVGKLLVILNREGQIIDVHALNPALFRQPEGICFSPEGDLYISNEGKGGKGYILKFKPRSDE